MGTLRIDSNFGDVGFIPKRYSYDFGNIIPPIRITGVPKSAKSLVLIIDDKDGDFENHFLVWNIPPQTKLIEEGTLPYDAIIGRNDFGLLDYIGPLADKKNHRYEFRIYAIDKVLYLGNNQTKEAILKAIEGHILDECSITRMFKE